MADTPARQDATGGHKQCENCDDGRVHSHNDICWVCDGTGWVPPRYSDASAATTGAKPPHSEGFAPGIDREGLAALELKVGSEATRVRRSVYDCLAERLAGWSFDVFRSVATQSIFFQSGHESAFWAVRSTLSQYSLAASVLLLSSFIRPPSLNCIPKRPHRCAASRGTPQGRRSH